MSKRLRHTGTSLLLGILAAGLVSAVATAVLPVSWRGSGTLMAVAVATIGVTILARGVTPPSP